jgi:beta-lactamase regulating signal transducer with metallopeptidase domain/HEAT repeat protein
MSQSMILLAWVAKATALLLVATGLTMALRRAPAGARYLVWLATLATLLVIPAVSSWSPIPVRILPAPTAPVATAPAPDLHSAVVTPRSGERTGLAPSNGVRASTTSAPASVAGRVWTAAQIVFAIWAAFVAGIFVWLLLGALAVRRIVSRAVTLDDDSWLHPMYDVADRLGLEHAPRVVMSNLIEMPFACGVTRPTIVLPRSAEQWSEERRRVVLFHELAHIRRRDLVGHTLGRLTCALYWFHPMVWSAAKRLRAESERACDDLVLACGGARPSEYANHLLEIVTSIRMQGAPATALPMADKKEFEGRMLAILDPAITRATPSRVQTVALTMGLVVLSFTIAAVTPAARTADASALTLASSATPAPLPTLSDTDRYTHKSTSMSTRMRMSTTTSTSTTMRTSGGDGLPTGAAVNPNAIASAAASAVASVQPRVQASWNNGWNADNLKRQAQVDTALLGRVLRTDKDAIVRKAAAWALEGHPEGVPLLLERLRVDQADEVRETAAWGLADAQSPDVAAALTNALKNDKSTEVRATAAWALGHQTSADADALVAALGDEDEDVRERSLWAIGQHHFDGVAMKVVPLLKDPRENIRTMAAWVLGELQDRSTIPALRDAFPIETSSETAQGEFRALLLMGDRSQELIDRAMKSPDPELRADAVRMLAGAGTRPWPWPWPWPWPRPEP